MPRQHDDYDDYGDTRGVHRRRIERKGSNTPIIVGAVVVVAALVGALLLALLTGGKDDPAVRDGKIREAADTFLNAVLSGNDKRILDTIYVEGPRGWVIKNLGVQNSKVYRGWETMPDVEAARAKRIEWDIRILREVKELAKRMAIEDTQTVAEVVRNGKIQEKMASQLLTITNKGGVAIISLTDANEGEFVVENWEVKNAASGRGRK